jgi:4-hydroxyphenylpyruvate dioxygenase
VPAEKIFFVQFADAPLLHMDPLQYSRHHRNFPFQGQFPLIDFIRALNATGYRGPYSLEIFNDTFRAAPANGIALDGYRSLILVREHLHTKSIPRMPEISGVEFIEFSCSRLELSLVTAYLSTHLGFRGIGHHRSKDACLFRRGQIYFVLNYSESETYASTFYLRTGVSVCAIALSVNDISLVISRAEKLKYRIIGQGKRGCGESGLVPIQAPDGTLIYLLDSRNPTSFLSDFEIGCNQPKSGRIAKVDYIAQAVRPSEMDKTVLFYRGLFGLALQEPLYEFNDPRGLVRSRAMTSEDGTIRFYLNVSEAESTVVGRFLSHSGPGVHYIGLTTDNIFETKLGRPFPVLPQNYFDDLAVRHDLSQSELQSLRDFNVMYDADDDGEFLHAFTETFNNLFFFEYVERRGKYAGFGGSNIMVRMVYLIFTLLTDFSPYNRDKNACPTSRAG